MKKLLSIILILCSLSIPASASQADEDYEFYVTESSDSDEDSIIIIDYPPNPNQVPSKHWVCSIGKSGNIKIESHDLTNFISLYEICDSQGRVLFQTSDHVGFTQDVYIIPEGIYFIKFHLTNQRVIGGWLSIWWANST